VKPKAADRRAPAHLGKVGRAFFERIVASWTLSEEGLELLAVAAEARDRMRTADELLKRDGLVMKSKRGSVSAHPAARIRRDAESTFLQALRQIGLEGMT
jgi:P27 family predicted phage terminase small subunit